MPPKKKPKSKAIQPEPEPEYEDEDPMAVMDHFPHIIDEEETEVTRCVCGQADGPEDSPGLMIQCETCKAWQHGICVGLAHERDCPETYYCEQCRPDLHVELLKQLKKTHHRNASSSMPLPSFVTHHNDSNKLTQLKVSTASQGAGQSTSQSHSSRSQSPLASAVSKNAAGNTAASTGASANANLQNKRRNTITSREAALDQALQDGDLVTLKALTGGDDDDSNGSNKKKRKRSGGTAQDAESNSKRKRGSEETPGSTTSEKPNLNDLDGIKEEVSTPVTATAPRSDSRRNKRAGRKEKEPSPDPEGSLPPPPVKKHANQYTYRGNKTNTTNGNSPAKATTGGNTTGGKSSAAGGQDGASNRGRGGNAGSAANSRGVTAMSPAPVPISWNLPDHLSHLADLLPTPAPVGVEVKPGANMDKITERGAKVKWPLKRTTIGEMRRRVRAMLDFVTKAQGDLLEREKRRQALDDALKLAEEEKGKTGKTKAKTSSNSSPKDESTGNDVPMEDAQSNETTEVPPNPADTTTASHGSRPPSPKPDPGLAKDSQASTARDASSISLHAETTAQMLASLTQDLLQFQERFGAGPGGKIYRERVERERRPRGAAAAANANLMERDDI